MDVELDNVSLPIDVTATHPELLIVHNNYFLGILISSDTLAANTIYMTRSTGTVMWSPGYTGTGTRALDVSTSQTYGFYSNPVYLESYNYYVTAEYATCNMSLQMAYSYL